MTISDTYNDEKAMFQLIASLSADCYGVSDGSMLGPNEMKHLLHWIMGYNLGHITWKKILKYLQVKLYNGEKNNGIYAVKLALIKKKWIEMDDDLIIIHDAFKIESPMHLEKTIKINAETDNK